MVNEMEAGSWGVAVLSRKALSRELIQMEGKSYRTPEANEKHQVPSGYNTTTGIDVVNKRV